MCDRLLYANLKNDAAALDEVHGLLEDLKGAWEQIEG
jgi:flagellar protein FliS